MIDELIEKIQRTDSDYDLLPTPIKMIYTPQEWQWLPAEHKNNIETMECIPDAGSD